MNRPVAIVLVLSLPFVAVAGDPDLKSVETHLQKVVDAAAPSVVSVVVSIWVVPVTEYAELA